MSGSESADIQFMRHALRRAGAAGCRGEVPVGAVLVAADGTMLAKAGNAAIRKRDPTAHAEVRVLRAAGKALGNYRLTGTTLYVTLEPCPMCASALVHARVERIVFAAADPRTGACGSVFDLVRDERLNHSVEVEGGLLENEAARLLREFFVARR